MSPWQKKAAPPVADVGMSAPVTRESQSVLEASAPLYKESDMDLKSGDVGTVIGPDAKFKGELTFDGAMRIDGGFEGKLASKGKLFLGKNAQITGELSVGQISIEGTLKGNITVAEKVELAATAQVLGDIRAPRLVIAEGATLVGNCHVSPDSLKGTITPPTKTAGSVFATTEATPRK